MFENMFWCAMFENMFGVHYLKIRFGVHYLKIRFGVHYLKMRFSINFTNVPVYGTYIQSLPLTHKHAEAEVSSFPCGGRSPYVPGRSPAEAAVRLAQQ